jgi:F0F1-type ATP synthase assembly protein I
MKNLKRNKVKLKNIIAEFLVFVAVLLLLKFHRFADGTMMTWGELLKFSPIVIIIVLAVGIRNHFLFPDEKNDKKNDKNESEQ